MSFALYYRQEIEMDITQLLHLMLGEGPCEILTGVASVRNLIREGKIHQIPSMMQTGQKLGMQTLDMSLQDLVVRGLISKEEAALKSSNPQLFGAAQTGTALSGTKLAAA